MLSYFSMQSDMLYRVERDCGVLWSWSQHNWPDTAGISSYLAMWQLLILKHMSFDSHNMAFCWSESIKDMWSPLKFFLSFENTVWSKGSVSQDYLAPRYSHKERSHKSRPLVNIITERFASVSWEMEIL